MHVCVRVRGTSVYTLPFSVRALLRILMQEQSVRRYKQWQVHHQAARDVDGAEEKIEERSWAIKVEDFSPHLSFVFFLTTANVHNSQANLASLTWRLVSLQAAMGQPYLLFPLTINASPYPHCSPRSPAPHV